MGEIKNQTTNPAPKWLTLRLAFPVFLASTEKAKNNSRHYPKAAYYQWLWKRIAWWPQPTRWTPPVPTWKERDNHMSYVERSAPAWNPQTWRGCASCVNKVTCSAFEPLSSGGRVWLEHYEIGFHFAYSGGSELLKQATSCLIEDE